MDLKNSVLDRRHLNLEVHFFFRFRKESAKEPGKNLQGNNSNIIEGGSVTITK